MSLERELLLLVDFNAMDEIGRVKASLRFATSAERPAQGEWVRLIDAERNTCLARVEEIRDLLVLARVEPATWLAGDVLALREQFAPRALVEGINVGSPTSGVPAHATGQLQAA